MIGTGATQLTSLQGPTPWPFPSPWIPWSVTASGKAYLADANSQVQVLAEDVSVLVNLGFSPLTGNAIAGTSYTLTKLDAGSVKAFTNSGAVTLTVPAGIWIPGYSIQVIQSGAGAVTFAAGTGVTITNHGGHTATGGTGALAQLIANPAVADHWILAGDTA